MEGGSALCKNLNSDTEIVQAEQTHQRSWCTFDGGKAVVGDDAHKWT